ncbi:hypothetical protein M404DRAFT_258337 [Pisolithus tinctorius Marx 270]|uniref:Uncharacterized protein n=1 Tax=Pisolithus tinctorius Marx 270 TaxID=870435 RepID=A0A0C3PM24_PISTI|nr:hypothetical protein M404DRAFT_258337 [Pisolithus tinctorius Marx 270]
MPETSDNLIVELIVFNCECRVLHTVGGERKFIRGFYFGRRRHISVEQINVEICREKDIKWRKKVGNDQ